MQAGIKIGIKRSYLIHLVQGIERQEKVILCQNCDSSQLRHLQPGHICLCKDPQVGLSASSDPSSSLTIQV